MVTRLILVFLRKFGGLGLLVWEEIENGQTVHKGLAKLLYRFPANVDRAENSPSCEPNICWFVTFITFETGGKFKI
jgi:hypothetical protein